MRILFKTALVLLYFFGVALAALPDDYAKWGRETLQTIERDHLIRDGQGYYEDQTKQAVAFTWGNSMLLLAYARAAAVDKQTYARPLDNLVTHMQKYWVVDKGIGGYDHLPHPKAKVERYYDDNAWIAMGLLDAYQATDKKAYLEQAEKTLAFCLSGVDPNEGGAWWRDYWDSEGQKTKNTCSVAPIAFACLRYYEITRQESYLKTARELLTWLDATLKDSDELYFDSISLSGQIGRTKWSYNSAMPLRCQIMLYKLTGDKNVLAQARRIARAAQERWYDTATSAIKCEAPFAFTLVEGWVELSIADNDPQWRQLAQKSLIFVHEKVRDGDGHYPKRWDRANNGRILTRWNLLYPAATARLIGGWQDCRNENIAWYYWIKVKICTKSDIKPIKEPNRMLQ